MSDREIEKINFAGLLTLSQSGDSKSLIAGIIGATKLGVTCINVVNVEDSPITRISAGVSQDMDLEKFTIKQQSQTVDLDQNLHEMSLARTPSTQAALW